MGAYKTMYLTISEISQILKVSKQTVRNLIKSGELRAIRVAHVFRVRKDIFDEYIKENEYL